MPSHLYGTLLPNQDKSKDLWSEDHDQPPHGGVAQQHQKIWDNLKASSIADTLLDNAPDSKACARLLTSNVKESGTWLNVLPISSLGLHMDNDTIQVASWALSWCSTHTCHHCGTHRLLSDTDTTVVNLGNWSDRLPMTKTSIPTLSRGCVCQCREETQHQWWEQMDTHILITFVNIAILSNELLAFHFLFAFIEQINCTPRCS